VHHNVALDDGRKVTAELVRAFEDEELAKLPHAQTAGRRFAEAREIFEAVALAPEYLEFLTLPALAYID
jgi:malate synthase